MMFFALPLQSLFEGSMYVFVFMWTPCLKALAPEGNGDLPFGLMFATFMVCCMAGSSTFTILMDKKEIKVEDLAVKILMIASCAFFTAAVSQSETIAFLAMNLFEVAVGMYFPSMGTQKGTIVPEAQRAAIYNIYRIPLNFIVLVSLLTKLTYRQSFAVCGSMLFVGSLLQMRLAKRRLVYSQVSTTDNSETAFAVNANEDKDETV